MMFGEWIRRLRKEQKLDIRTFAEQSGVEASTISRVENERTQVTLLIAIRLCEGLGVTVSDVLTKVYGVPMPTNSEQEETTWKQTVPTVDDVEHFLHYFHDQRDEAQNWLTNLLNNISAFNLNSELKGMIHPMVPRFFAPEDIQKLLFDSPLYRFELQYPPSVTPNHIVSLYRHGALLTPTDITEFIKKLRREKQVTLAKLDREAKISQNVLSRLESSFIEQIKLADVLMLDEVLEQEGTLLRMYWSVYSFYQSLVRRSATTADQEMRVASIFIIICRWIQSMNPTDNSWLQPMRSSKRPA